MFKNDERYWDINLLNKWFAISSIIFLACTIWMFIDDNDDEFKDYQREFRKLETAVVEKKLEEELEQVKTDRSVLESQLSEAEIDFEKNKVQLKELEDSLKILKDRYYVENNMTYQAYKAEVDVTKYLIEAENAHGGNEKKLNKLTKRFEKENAKLYEYKLAKQKTEVKIAKTENKIRDIKSNVKNQKKELDGFLKKVNLASNRLQSLDRERMSFQNKIADFIRDLPILDFMAPYYKVNQIVVKDVKYDVNFAAVPQVDRCTSCHLGIGNPDFVDAPQPYTTHPNLDLYITSASPHPMEDFGCTGCHAGRGRGTSFISSSHTPNTPQDKKRWKEEYDWEKIHHWLQPMYPAKYTQAGCFKCHTNTSDLAGAEKLNFGLSLINNSGCNGCHYNANWESVGMAGPDLRKVNEKLDKKWVKNWIKNPRHFRYNTRMPAIFEQANQEDPVVYKRNNAEIVAITEYLFNNKSSSVDNSIDKNYIGDPENGEALYTNLGCMGCHIAEEDPQNSPKINSYYNLTKLQGPNLIGLGSKVSAKWLYEWLMDPHEYMPTTRMPNLRLEPEQAKDITAYLLESQNKEFATTEPPKAEPEYIDIVALDWLKKVNPDKYAKKKLDQMSENEKMLLIGEKSIRHYGCYGCHNIDGFEDAKPIGVELTYEGSKPVNKFDFGLYHDIDHTVHDWIENKLKSPRIYDRGKESAPLDLLRMPNFYYSEEEIEAVTTAVLSFNSDKVGEPLLAHLKKPEVYKEGHRLVKKYNCQGCHLMENKGGQLVNTMGAPEYAPPNLNTEGKKANPDWLLTFLENPNVIRPNLQVRMPSFHQISNEEWDKIIQYFQLIDETKRLYRSEHLVDKNSTEFHAGEKLHEFGACNNCHFYGDEFPKQAASTWAPNLALTKERLNPDWVKEWLRNPQEIMPGTKMPAVYLPTEDILSVENADDTWGRELVELSGNQDAMLDGIRDYLWDIKGPTDISDIVKEYFDKNGYDFDLGDEDDEDDWDEDDWED